MIKLKILYKLQLYVPHSILRYIKRRVQLENLNQWEKSGFPVPPPHIVKVYLLKYLAREKSLKIFVETGTYMGDMVDEMKNSFERIYSIELFESLYERAVKIFSNESHINILNGDSSKLLTKVVSQLKKPTLFWLDAHYSGSGTAKAKIDTPIEKELKILKKITIPHVIVIDDARCFTGANNYPKLSQLEKKYRSTYRINVIHDMMVLTMISNK